MKRFTGICALFMVLISTIGFGADIPKLINYQGMLTNSSGNPLTGTYDIDFKLYNASSAGDMRWEETQTDVAVTNGLFNVILGGATIGGIDLDFSEEYWLEIWVDGEQMSDRLRFTSVGYAYRAMVADSAVVAGSSAGGVGGWVDDGAVVRLQTSTDKVGIGTPSPGEELEIHSTYPYVKFSGHSTSDDYQIGVNNYGLAIYNSDDSRCEMVIDSNGNVGVGTTSPSYKLHVSQEGTSPAVYGRYESVGNYGTLGSAVSGAYGSSSNDIGVYGVSSNGLGVWGLSTSGTGVYYSHGLAGTGSKSCVVKTSKGPTLLYCQESPENWFEDFGEAQLSAGRCHIELDPLFLETVTIDDRNPMKVFIQLNDDCSGTYVERGKTGFEVIELQGGQGNARFTYRAVAKRSGFEDKRLDVCEVARNDPYLYPEVEGKADR